MRHFVETDTNDAATVIQPFRDRRKFWTAAGPKKLLRLAVAFFPKAAMLDAAVEHLDIQVMENPQVNLVQ